MRMIFLATVALLMTACSTLNDVALADGQYMITLTDRSVGGSGSTVVKKAMDVATKRCGEGNVKVVSMQNSGFQVGTFPDATMIYECKSKSP
jgi:hypothetical protein